MRNSVGEEPLLERSGELARASELIEAARAAAAGCWAVVRPPGIGKYHPACGGGPPRRRVRTAGAPLARVDAHGRLHRAGNVDRWIAEGLGGDDGFGVSEIPFPETREYVDRVPDVQPEYRSRYEAELGY